MKHTFSLRYSHVSTYFSIAKQSYENAQRYSGQISKLPDPPDEDVIFMAHQLGKEEYNEVIIYVIFIALTAEALINKYLFLQRQAGKISKRLFDHIDKKMSTEEKWGLATQYLSSSKAQELLDYEREPMQNLISLFKLRNQLVHAKQRKLDIVTHNSDGNLIRQDSSEKPSPYNLAFENTKHYLETVQHLMRVLQELDSESISDWLNNDDWVEPIVIKEE
jgi:hypothetical protein